jgi:hypothetical protein
MTRANGIGETEGRLEFGLLSPRGAVTPQATFEPGVTDFTPVTTALQMRA